MLNRKITMNTQNSVRDALSTISDVEHRSYCGLVYDLIENNYKDFKNG